MAWLSRSLGDSVSSLTGHLSNLTKDILTEGTEEVSDYATELNLAKEKIQQLDIAYAGQKSENERLKHVIRELEEKAESSELQINAISREYRSLLEEKEKEINKVKEQHHELLEHQAKAALCPAQETVATLPLSLPKTGQLQDFQDDGFEFDGWATEEWGDFDDSLRLQREVNHLRQEVGRLHADSQHWRSVAGQLSQAGGLALDHQVQHQVLNLQAKVKELEKNAATTREEAQHEIASLQDIHRSKMTALKKSQKEEISQLKLKVADLEQQLADAMVRDGDSMHTASSSVLPESDRVEAEVPVDSLSMLRHQLTILDQEKDKMSAAKTQLEGLVAELQEEVERHRVSRAEQAARIADLEASVSHQAQRHIQEVQVVQQHMEEYEEERRAFAQGQQQESRLKSGIVEAGMQVQEVSKETADLIERLGDTEQQEKAAAFVDSIERENLLLREENIKLQEQITLLERQVSKHLEDWQQNQDTISSLRRQLRVNAERVQSDSENTLDQSFTSGSHQSASEREKDAEVSDWQIEKEAMEDVLVDLRKELQEKENCIMQLLEGEKEGQTDDEVQSLRDSLFHLKQEQEATQQELLAVKESEELLQLELSSLREREEVLQAERQELETSLGELDDQYQEATSHLVSMRDSLQTQLSAAQLQVKELQEELHRLRQQQEGPVSFTSSITASVGKSLEVHHKDSGEQLIPPTSGTNSPTESSSSSFEIVEDLKQELRKVQDDLAATAQQLELRDVEVAELKVKLQKGTMALNELHMDKRELEETVRGKKEEIEDKVAKIKALREEKLCLKKENEDLSERLQEVEEELESWQQRNEDSQMNKTEKDRLQAELSAAQAAMLSMQQRMDSMFVDSEELNSLCKKLQVENLRISEDLVRQRDAFSLEKELALQKTGQLQAEVTSLHAMTQDAEKEARDVVGAASVAELKSEIVRLRKQADLERAEKEQVERTLCELEAQVKGTECGAEPRVHSEHGNTEFSVENLHRLNQDLVDVLSQQRTLLEKIHLTFFAGQAIEKLTGSQSSDQDVVSLPLSSPWEQNRCLLNSLRRQLKVIDEMTKQDVMQASSVPTESAGKSVVAHGASLGEPSREVLEQKDSQQLLEMVRARDQEILRLTESLNLCELDRKEVEEATARAAESHQHLMKLLSDRESELQTLKEENACLMMLCEEVKAKLCHAESTADTLNQQLQDAENSMQQLKADQVSTIEFYKHSVIEENKRLQELVSKLEQEFKASQEKITSLETELTTKEDTLLCYQAGIQEMNDKFEEQGKALAEEQKKTSRLDDVIALLHETSLNKDEEIETLKSRLCRAFRFLSHEQQITVAENQEPLPLSPSINLPALEFPPRPALELQKGLDTEFGEGEKEKSEVKKDSVDAETYYAVEEVDDEEENSIQAAEDMASIIQSMDELRTRLEEKDQIISDLQRQNSRLLQMLDSRSLSDHGSKDAINVHKLESEVKALKVEKEQMMAVLNEKSREASSLKAEVIRLMNIISAEKSALEKLQRDNQELMVSKTQQKGDILDDMHREALQNLSRLVRDREVEIEALKQKNATLMAVLQDLNQEWPGGSAEGSNLAASLSAHLADNENLQKQLAALQAEREQMVAFVNQKHSESLAYHAEIQRLIALRAEENKHSEQLKAEYDKLCQQFEDKNQSLLKAQNDIINYRQKCSELEVKYGEVLQKSSALSTVDATTYQVVEEEKRRLAAKQDELQHMLCERDEKIRTMNQKLNEMENSVLARESEASSLKKQVDSLVFQLHSLGRQKDEVFKEREALEEKMQQRDSEVKILKDLNDHLTLTVQEKEFEVASLKDRLQKTLALASEQQGEKTQVTRLLQDQEATAAAMGQMQQERDQLMLALKQRQQDLGTMQTENLQLKEKEQKLSREVERLRGHLLQIEEAYTHEALEAEEREKNLRNKLAAAEEKLLSSTHDIQMASQEASQRVESLQQQLQVIATQRDAAYMQVAGLQDQCQQYSLSLSNLQLVLEQFQRDKESQIAIEIEHYQKQSQQLQKKMDQLQAQLQHTKRELEEASDGLAAASRLSEQLDMKEEVIQTLREEVKQRELELSKAEEEIQKLCSSTEAKVDKVLMKNLILSYFHTPDKNRVDAIHSIGSLLGFTQEDFRQMEEGQGQSSWVASLLKRTPRSQGTTPPSTPTRQGRDSGFSQSFSQLFVNFLEKESRPPPAPIRLPAEEMARETQQRHLSKERDSHKTPVFNPFTAPRHVAMPVPVGPYASTSASSSSPLLMAPPGSPTAGFPIFTPFIFSEESRQSGGHSHPPAQTSSTILKDVLDSR